MTALIFTVGICPELDDELFRPIGTLANIRFIHGLAGKRSLAKVAQKKYPRSEFVSLSNDDNDLVTAPDFLFLASLESAGLPTIKSMVKGDRVVRLRSEREAFGYATLIGKNIKEILEGLKPDVVIASFDSLHSSMSLAVAKSLGIPWVALSMPPIPKNLTAFAFSMTPNSLVPIKRSVDQRLRAQALDLIHEHRRRSITPNAYVAASSLKTYLALYLLRAKNLIRRIQPSKFTGTDSFIHPTISESVRDTLRRTYNHLRLPLDKMLKVVPKEDFAYYPLQMAPESSIDTWAPFYQDQLSFISQLSQAIPCDMQLVVKLHFSDPGSYNRKQLLQLMQLPRVRVAHFSVSSRQLIENAKLVIGIQGTACLEAALLGKPVLMFGDSPYLNFPSVERAKRPDELFNQIQNLIKFPGPAEEELVEACANYIARYFDASIAKLANWDLKITTEEHRKMADGFLALIEYIGQPGTRKNWYKSPPFVTES